ncbi:hypothetical protein BCY91_12070 [Pelobium manganitolerans]|uniref:DUF2442 domain-containing protein n=1 Tax=Pelobium manganitolerans TaxID=1842495 RepID=A0A419S1L2_9SPHI|nr:hypothetical protein BCY91_12070 [Pelobium manganitolerans]
MIDTRIVDSIEFIEDCLCLTVNGKKYTISLIEVSQKLLNASDIERNFYKISPSGYGIHWPLLDEDLAIAHLIN